MYDVVMNIDNMTAKNMDTMKDNNVISFDKDL